MTAIEQLLSDAADVVDDGVAANAVLRAQVIELCAAGQQPTCTRVIMPGHTVTIVVSKA